MKNQIFKLTAFYFTIIVSMPIEAVQNVYQYQNSEGVTEFTDAVKANQEPEKQFQIKKMTAEEEAQSQQKLEQIMEKDKALDKRLTRERRLENERRLRYQEQQAAQRKERNSEDDSDDNNFYGGGYYRRPGLPLNPGRPMRPKPGVPVNPDRPIRPKPPGLKPGHRPGTLPVRR